MILFWYMENIVHLFVVRIICVFFLLVTSNSYIAYILLNFIFNFRVFRPLCLIEYIYFVGIMSQKNAH